MKVLREIEKIARSLSIIYANSYREMDIKRGQYVYISFVNENPGLSQLDMVNQLNIDKTTVTKALQKLVKAGIVFRQRDPSDGRISRVYPTQYGREIYQKILENEKRVHQQLLDSFSEKEEFDMESHLSRISKALEGEWKNSRDYLSVGIIRKATYEELKPFKERLHYQNDHDYYVCIYKEKVVGYMHCSQENHQDLSKIRWDQNQQSLFLEDIYILENMRKRGFGYQLFKWMEHLSREKSIERMRTIVNEKNIPMLKLVNMMEFRFVGEHVDKEISMFCFEKKLN